MLTLYTKPDTLIQLHKSEVNAAPGSSCALLLRSVLSGEQVSILATVKELANCFLLSFTGAVDTGDLNNVLEVYNAADQLVFTAPIQIKALNG